jgi:phage terminase large subunit
MLLRRMKYPKTNGLILRRTYNELYKSHIIKLFEEYPHMRAWYRESHKELNLPNGSKLFFGSAEHEGDMENFYSSEFADIWPDEAQEFSQSELEKLAGSNRCTSNPDIMSKMIFTFMPGFSENGLPPKGLSYLKRVFADHDLRGPEKQKQWKFIQAFAWDNIEWARKELERDGIDEEAFYSWSPEVRREYFLRSEYGATLAAMTDEHLRDAWLEGKWDVFQGQYFSNFDQTKHVISDKEVQERIRPWHKRWLSGDWGFDHPHAIYKHVIDETGHVITYWEQWAREVGEVDLGKQISAACAGEKFIAFPFSWDAGKQSPRSPRQAPKSHVQLINDTLAPGIPKAFPADSSPGSRISRARLMSQMLDSGFWQISEKCVHLIECLPSLIRDPKNTEDVMKVDYPENNIGDDPYDAASMGLQFMCGSSKKPQTEIIREKAETIVDGAERFFYTYKAMADLKASQQPVKQKTVPSWQQRMQD